MIYTKIPKIWKKLGEKINNRETHGLVHTLWVSILVLKLYMPPPSQSVNHAYCALGVSLDIKRSLT